jgi:Uma2 family endonuclease
MSLARKIKDSYTYADYARWPKDERWELIAGEAYAMSPAPSTRHQRISQNLSFQLESYFRKKPCQVFPAPTDLKLSESDVLQPDLMVVCDETQIQAQFIAGPPTLVVEIVSPSSENLDHVRKLRTYAKFGLQEYWIVTPFPSRVEVFQLDGETYRLHGAYEKTDGFISPAFPELTLSLPELFDFPLEAHEQTWLEVKEPPASYQ